MLRPLHHFTQDKSRSNALAALWILEMRAKDHKEAAEVLEKIRMRAHFAERGAS